MGVLASVANSYTATKNNNFKAHRGGKEFTMMNTNVNVTINPATALLEAYNNLGITANVEGYISKDGLRDILNENLPKLDLDQFPKAFSKKATRKEMAKVLSDVIDFLMEDDADDYESQAEDESQEAMRDSQSDNSVEVGDLPITRDNTPEEAPVASEEHVQWVNAEQWCKTFDVIHAIGDFSLTNRHNGYGTTISGFMLVAKIAEVAFGIKKAKDHVWLDSEKETITNVRNWLVKNGYLTVATFKDEKGRVFFNENYDGRNADRMLDLKHNTPEGRCVTTTYRVTKECNRWYSANNVQARRQLAGMLSN